MAGRYRLIEPLGRGGMGVVWRAADELLRREVAVKELLGLADLAGDEREMFTTRTLREARAAGRLSHPGVAAVYDVFQENGHPWIVMQLVPSRTLGSIIREEGPLPVRRVAAIGVEVLAALRAAHAAGVLHRDVKPDNVLITGDGHAVLTDFGIATLEDDSPVTRTGMLVGTPAFIAPERAMGGPAEPASDLWALGVTMFQAVEGRPPFRRGSALATLAAILYQEPEPLLRAGALASVIEGLLVKDPAARMTASEAARRLHAVAAGEVAEPGQSPTRVSLPSPRGWRGRFAWTAAGVLAVGVASGALSYETARATDPGTVAAPTATVFQTHTASPAPVHTAQPARYSDLAASAQPGRHRQPSATTGRGPKAMPPPSKPSTVKPRTSPQKPESGEKHGPAKAKDKAKYKDKAKDKAMNKAKAKNKNKAKGGNGNGKQH
ncbi:serine/threonine-protein kinase [Sphaerisporangium flaviroseum]|uniref:serine/threonine-protein kinase n=1 Tax=Sphaerisporangium flaviroseum TaxID=509199 RepID=UPI0031E79D17